MQDWRGAPRIAEIFEREKGPADLFGACIILSHTGFEQLTAQSWREHARAGSEAVQFEIAQMNNGGALADAADDAIRRHTAQQGSEIGIVGRIFAHDGVLDRTADLGVDEAPDRIKARVAIGTKIGFVLDVNRERNAASFSYFAQTGFEAHSVARIAARQYEDGWKTMLANERGLIDGPAVGGSDGGNDREISGERRNPVDELVIIGERDVIEKRVAAINHVGYAMLLQVAENSLVLDEIDRAAGIALPRKRRDRIHARRLGRTGRGGHADTPNGSLLQEFFTRHVGHLWSEITSSLYNDGFTVLELISSTVRDHAEALRSEFQSAKPFRHLVLNDFLTPDFCRQLMAEFPAFDPNKARNELGELGGKAVFTNLPRLGPAYARLDKMLGNREFLGFMGQITGIPDLLYDPDYVGGGTHENLHGQDLDPHVDFNYHPVTQLHRRLNLIIFLNPEWQEEWGGALELHLNPWLPPDENPLETIVPISNRAVVFETSEISWHGFKRISLPPEKRHLSRRSIAVYYYTKRRPEEEVASPHSTIYVPRPLPETIKTGHTLSQADVDLVRVLVARRDQQIRFLYEREKEFSTAVQVMMGSKAYRFYMTMILPLRKPWSWFKTRHLR